MVSAVRQRASAWIAGLFALALLLGPMQALQGSASAGLLGDVPICRAAAPSDRPAHHPAGQHHGLCCMLVCAAHGWLTGSAGPLLPLPSQAAIRLPGETPFSIAVRRIWRSFAARAPPPVFA